MFSSRCLYFQALHFNLYSNTNNAHGKQRKIDGDSVFFTYFFPFQNCLIASTKCGNIYIYIYSTELFWFFNLNQVTIYPQVIFGTLHSVSLTYVSISKVKQYVLMKCSEIMYKENKFLGQSSSHGCPSHFIFKLMVKLSKYVPNLFFMYRTVFWTL